MTMQISDNGIARRNRDDLYTAAEKAIWHAMRVVEDVGAHPLLTDAVILLGTARDKVADFVEWPVAASDIRDQYEGLDLDVLLDHFAAAEADHTDDAAGEAVQIRAAIHARFNELPPYPGDE